MLVTMRNWIIQILLVGNVQRYSHFGKTVGQFLTKLTMC